MSAGTGTRVAGLAGGTQRSQRGLQAQTFPCPLLMGWQLLQPELPKSRACVCLGWGESDPLQDGVVEMSRGGAKPSPSVCISVIGPFPAAGFGVVVPVP